MCLPLKPLFLSIMNSEMDAANETDYMALIRYGEDLLTEIIQKVQDMMALSRQLGIPVDRTQMQMVSKRLQQPLEDNLKVLPVFFKRMKMIEKLIHDLLEADGPQPTAEELIPLRDDAVGALPVSFEEELRPKVSPDLWKEYVDVKEKLSRRDAYLKTIIDTERAILQEINCVLNP